jgi:hypothetical protein
MKIGKLATKVGAVALGGLLVVVGVWYGLFWRSETSHLQVERQDQAQASNNVSMLQGQVAALEALQKKIPAERAQLAKLRQVVPDGPSLDQLLVTIVDAASKAGVAVQSVGMPVPSGWGGSPAAGATAPTASGPQSITLPISVSGDAARLMRFITALDAESRLFVVTQFSLSSPSVAGAAQAAAAQGTTSLTVEAFYVSAASADPAADFAVKLPSSASQPGQSVGANDDFLAEARATDVLTAEQAYFGARHVFVDTRTALGARALGVSSASLSEQIVPGTGQVLAAAGTLSGSRWSSVAPGRTAPALLVEALSGSGTCFYSLTYTKAAKVVTAYAATGGGCASSVSGPAAVRPGAARSSKVANAGAGVGPSSWFTSW